ncbi:MAG: glycosyl hydrolase family 28-related protein [Planctomycetota bacterium]|jgi:hypothetical protein|nr:glycosyl hydrolase family 28-related protein [Planctomycetota bacterium]
MVRIGSRLVLHLCFILAFHGMEIANQTVSATEAGSDFTNLSDVAFPVCSSVINVKLPPYNAKGDGQSDDTQAIQNAIDDLMGQHRILYFPEGEYLISRTIRWSKKHSSGSDAWGHNWIQGQNVNKTKITLQDGVFNNANNPQSMMWCGGFGSADWFHNYVEDITFDVGSNNAGAIAIQFYSNNYGAIRNCRFLDRKSHAAIGLDLGFQDMNGPLFVKNCEVLGFRIGIKTGHAVNGQTFEYIHMKDQSEVGFLNEGQSISVRKLLSRNKVPAIKTYGTFALIESTLEGLVGASVHPAVLNFNNGRTYIRGLSTSGYGRAVVSIQTPDQSAAYRLLSSDQPEGVGPNVVEFSSQAPLSLFETKNASQRLPIFDSPELKAEPVARWANVVDFGADPTGTKDSSAAIQRAVDSGASTLFLPGFFRLTATVELRANVSRVIGTGGWVDYESKARPDFRIQDGSSSEGSNPIIKIEHLSSINGGIEVNTSRTICLKSIGVKQQIVFTEKARGGKLFMEDVTTNDLALNEQKVWARQLNVENEGSHIFNRASDLWVLGYKTERGGTLLHTTSGGRSEILGGFSYTTTAGDLAPMFVIENASVFAFFGEVCYTGNPFKTIVREKQNGIEKLLRRGEGETVPYVAEARAGAK